MVGKLASARGHAGLQADRTGVHRHRPGSVALTRAANAMHYDGALGSNKTTTVSQNATRTRNHMDLPSRSFRRFARGIRHPSDPDAFVSMGDSSGPATDTPRKALDRARR